jgi:hypothetical protein
MTYTAFVPFAGGNDLTVADLSLLVLSSVHETLPSGTTYSVQIRKLGLGAPKEVQYILSPPDIAMTEGTSNGAFLPEYAYQSYDVSASNSYGLYVGSAAFIIPGSLILGGYGQNRVIGPVSSQPYILDHLPIDLLDIGIGVADGLPPFAFTSKTGLLASGNSSIGLSTTVYIEAPVSYIYLPQSTCNDITKNSLCHILGRSWAILLEHRRSALQNDHLVACISLLHISP